MLIQSQLSCR